MDPEKKEELCKATTRRQIRTLIKTGIIRRAKPRVGQSFVMPPQYMSKFRKRLLCDPRVREVPRSKTVRPTSGTKYRWPEFWRREGDMLEEARPLMANGERAKKQDKRLLDPRRRKTTEEKD